MLDQQHVISGLLLTTKTDQTEFDYDIIDILKDILGETNLRTNAVGFKLFCIFAALADKIVDLEKHLDTGGDDARNKLSVGQKLTLQLQRAKNLFYMCGVNRETGTISIANVEHEIKCVRCSLV